MSNNSSYASSSSSSNSSYASSSSSSSSSSNSSYASSSSSSNSSFTAYSSSRCYSPFYYYYYRNDGDHDPVKIYLEAAMLWVVGYAVVAASAVCMLAMAADAVKVFRHKKLWSPCQYFSLNSTTLILLGIATKLPMDARGDGKYSVLNLLPKFNGVVFLSAAMANFMSSLGSRENKDVRANVAALAILVTTMAVNVLLQVAALYSSGYEMAYLALLYTIILLLLLSTVASLAVAAPAMKRTLEFMYQQKHELALQGEKAETLHTQKKRGRMDRPSMKRMTERMMKYWVMAESSCPEFVMARSVVCTTSALLCLLSEIPLFFISVLIAINGESVSYPFGWVTESIFYIQLTGILVGSVAPMLRWLVVVTFKCTKYYSSPKEEKPPLSCADVLKKLFKVESYWTQTMVDWRDNVPVWGIWDASCQYYYLHIPKRVVLTFCIGLQTLVVLLSKLFIFVSAVFMTPFFLSYTCIKNFSKKYSLKKHKGDDEMDLYLKEYVLLLDGEAELPGGVLSGICQRARNTIKTGINNEPRHLIMLLEEFIDYRGMEGTVDEVSQDIGFPNCWTLPVVTLACIAQALPSSGNDGKRQQLLTGVSEGLSLARLVDDIHNATLVNIRRAADKFPDFDFKRYSRFQSSKNVLEALSTKAEAEVKKFNEKFNKDPSSRDPLNWPTNIVAAKSMFGVTHALLSWLEKGKDDKLFEQISAMIAFMLAASLTNLPEVITTMCQSSAIEKREKSVRKAFLLLGKTEKILELVQKKRPISDDETAPAPVEVRLWRSLFLENANAAKASSIDL